MTSSIRGKRNAARRHWMQRIERSVLETEEKAQKTALIITENWYGKIVATLATPSNTATRDRKKLSRTNRCRTKELQNEARNQRRAIEVILKHAPKIKQLTEDCRFDGQPEYEYEYEDNETFN